MANTRAVARVCARGGLNMAGAVVDTGSGRRRRSLDSELNMVPMIDLLMVTISFLLLTAVWVRAGRVEANAQVSGARGPCGGCADGPPERRLHVEMRDPARFALYWTDGGREVRRTEVPREEVVEVVQKARQVRYPGLRDAVKKEWDEMGRHRAPGDREMDHVVLRADDASSYAQVIGAMDAVRGVERPLAAAAGSPVVPAFQLTFAAR
jgi:biopolymer transport protein ExbD